MRRGLLILVHALLGLAFLATSRAADDADSIRRQLAAFQRAPNPAALDFAWPYLDSPEAGLREAARKTVQAQPFADWKDRALEEKSTWASLEILRALTESCPRGEAAALSPHLCEQISTLRLEAMDPAQLRAAIRLTRLVFDRLGPVSEDERQQMVDTWSHLSPPADALAATDWRALLEFLRAVHPRRS